jgi:hypothetical protein
MYVYYMHAYHKEALMSTRYWIGVVSLSHVQKGVAGGYAQVGHGKAAPLRRMQAGDWFIYYSPKTDMEHGEPLQQFTAMGRVKDDRVYEFAMSRDFVPSRRDISYVKCKAAPIQPLIPGLSFITDPVRWGYPFRRGLLEITRKDFELIAGAMEAHIDA